VASEPISGQTPIISRTRLDMAVHDMLRLFVGRGREWRVPDLAAASGVAARKIECARCEPGDPEHRPLDREELASVMSVLGAKAQSVILSLMGTGAHDLVALEMDPAALLGLLMEGGTEFVKRGVDGVFCNGDRGDLRPWADQMIAALTPFSSKARD
jgi:hypothetical protein